MHYKEVFINFFLKADKVDFLSKEKKKQNKENQTKQWSNSIISKQATRTSISYTKAHKF